MNPVLSAMVSLALATVAFAAQTTQPATAVVNPWVTTDHSVDARTVGSIVSSLVRPGMTDEQKVLACFNWIRRMIYHGDGPQNLAYNFGNMIHSFGNGSCLRQTTPLWVLLDRLGYKCRTGAVGGHHIIEVNYGGAWHLFDPHMTFYVYDRGKPASIASIEQINADPTLVTDAVKEGRACPGFLLCGDTPDTFTKASAYKIFGDFPESKRTVPVIEEPFGRVTLRRGETYVRTWMPGEYWFKANWYKKDEGPRHGCGINRDAKDSVNLPLYEPHAAGRAYRHWSAGWLVYKPDIASGHFLDAVVDQKNVVISRLGTANGSTVTEPCLTCSSADSSAEIVFSVNCPYVITAGELKLRRLGKLPAVSVAVSVDQGKNWTPIQLNGDSSVSATVVDEVQGAINGYWLKLTLTGTAAVADLELKTHFQINPYSLPYLVPGRNVVSMSGEQFGSPVKLEWVYAEGPEWKRNKTASHTFDKPGKFEIEVGGEKYPRNVSLSLSVAP